MRFFSGRLMSHHPESCGFHPHPHPRRFIRRFLTDEYIHDNLSISLGVLSPSINSIIILHWHCLNIITFHLSTHSTAYFTYRSDFYFYRSSRNNCQSACADLQSASGRSLVLHPHGLSLVVHHSLAIDDIRNNFRDALATVTRCDNLVG